MQILLRRCARIAGLTVIFVAWMGIANCDSLIAQESEKDSNQKETKQDAKIAPTLKSDKSQSPVFEHIKPLALPVVPTFDASNSKLDTAKKENPAILKSISDLLSGKNAANGKGNTTTGITPTPSNPALAKRAKVDTMKTVKGVFNATFLVIVVAGVALVILKFYVQPGKINSKHKTSKIRELESYRLSAKCDLKLVEVDGSQFIFALDQTGIKSVKPVSKPFDSMFGDEPEDPEDSFQHEPTDKENSLVQLYRAHLGGKDSWMS